jgi:hypothetical protein
MKFGLSWSGGRLRRFFDGAFAVLFGYEGLKIVTSKLV